MQKWLRSICLILLFSMVGAARLAVAEGRLSDKDLQRLMQNLKDDAQPFRQSFANALKKSTIRKTSREKDARALADTFARQANGALETFKHRQKADRAVTALVNTAAQIDPLAYSLQLNPQTTSHFPVGAAARGATPDRTGVWRRGTLLRTATRERFGSAERYRNLSQCCRY
jgi:hypothetical protein